MRTAGNIQQGTPSPDGHIFVEANLGYVTAGTATMARSGKGLVSLNIGASQNVTVDLPLSKLLFRYGMQDDLQQYWGSTANGGQNARATPPAVYVSTGPQLQRAPFTGSSQLVPPTSRPTGISINAVTGVFNQVNAGTNTIGISKTQFSTTAGAPVVTDIIPATTLGTATFGNVIGVTIPVNTTINFLTSRLAEYILEWQVNTNAGGVALLFGVFLDVTYNYN